ncbi:MAG TPA: isoprenylcysteine carboxylmethyltransferase family protein [Blastocatellia bacterium]|nr:isoprenylcysteine carboxylmethyltransferase family protein [Blastocatellia bacterium]
MGRHFDSNVLSVRMRSRRLQATDPNTGGKPDVANPGLVRPPLVYSSSIMAGALLTWLWPLPFALPAAVPIGSTMVFASILLFLFSVRALRAAGAPAPGNQPTTNIVRTGPYRFSRNPIYLSFFVLQLGIALWISSIWMVATLIPAAAVVSRVVVPREERYLESRFGQQYSSYRDSTRRWL